MRWWLDLSDSAVVRVEIIEGNPRLVAVWWTRTEVEFYAVSDGVCHGTLELPTADIPDPFQHSWQGYVDQLRAPSGAPLASVDTGAGVVLTSHDGRLTLYWNRSNGVSLTSDGHSMTLPRYVDAPVTAIGLDRDFGSVGLLARSGEIEFYQQHVHIGTAAISDVDDGVPLQVMLPDATDAAVAIYERCGVIVDFGGRSRHKTVFPFTAGASACAPSGELIVVGDDLGPTLQVFDESLAVIARGNAHGLLESAHAPQLMPRGPAHGAPIEAIAVADDGVLVFAIHGVVCCSHIANLPEQPYARPLF